MFIMEKNRFLVTGAQGRIGSWVANQEGGGEARRNPRDTSGGPGDYENRRFRAILRNGSRVLL